MRAFKKLREISQWKIIYVVFLIILAIALMWYYQSAPRAELADKGQTRITVKSDNEMKLNLITGRMGLPSEFVFKGYTWKAVSSMLDNIDLIAAGSFINGDELYYKQGIPAKSYKILYLRGNTAEYKDVYVRYEPVNQK